VSSAPLPAAAPSRPGEPSSAHEALLARVEAALREVIDPEIGLDVVELGLVYGVELDPHGQVRVRLTMTTPACPLGEHIAADAEARVASVEGVSRVDVELVWDPPWTPERLSASAKATLGW
jgi:metal-sulfur cluster biosynthetic enzyme